MRLPCAAGADGVRKCRGDRMLRIWGPKGTGRFQIEPEAAGPGKTAPGLEPEASLEVPSAEPFTPYLSAIGVRARWAAGSSAESGTCFMRRLPPFTKTSRTWSRTSLMPDLFR